MYTTGPVVRSFNRGGRLQLNVNTSNYFARYNISLAWYHNGTRIFSGSKFAITDNNTVLTITDMIPSDAGEYTVRVSSIDVSDYWGYHGDPRCEALVLPSLELMAAHAPVTFMVQQDCLPEYNLLIAILYFFTENHDHIELSTTETSQNDYSYWYRNGNRLSDSAIYNLTVSRQVSSVVITINDTDAATGSYVGFSQFDVIELYFGRYFCREYYYYIAGDLGTSSIPSSLSYWKVIFQSKYI